MAIIVRSSQGYTKNGSGSYSLIVNDGNIYLGPTSTLTLGTINLLPAQPNISTATTFYQCVRVLPSLLSVACTNASKSYTKIVNDGNIYFDPTSTSMLVTVNQLSKQLSIMVATENHLPPERKRGTELAISNRPNTKNQIANHTLLKSIV